MAHVQPRSLGGGDEELTAIGAWSRVGHGENACLVEPKIGDALVLERLAPDRLSAASRTSWVAALDHEFRDYAVENDAVVVAVFHVSREVLASFRSDFRVELEFDGSLIRFELDAGFAHRGLVLEFGFRRGKEIWERLVAGMEGLRGREVGVDGSSFLVEAGRSD